LLMMGCGRRTNNGLGKGINAREGRGGGGGGGTAMSTITTTAAHPRNLVRTIWPLKTAATKRRT
jgi:hypothetical protein